MKALVVLGGKAIELKEYIDTVDIVICADSGADTLTAQGYMPDVLLGDFDSISEASFEKCRNANVEILKYPLEKDMTDGQIAVLYAKEKEISHIDIVCAEGSMDHFMGNLYLLIFAKDLKITAALHTKDMTAYAVDDKITLFGNIGDRVSIIPAEGEVTVENTSGLYYSVKSETLIKPGQTVGLGNHLTSTHAEINIKKGTAFVFAEKRQKNT